MERLRPLFGLLGFLLSIGSRFLSGFRRSCFLDSVVGILGRLGRLATLVGQRDVEALIKEGHLLQAPSDCLELKLCCFENVRIRPESDRRPCSAGFFALD